MMQTGMVKQNVNTYRSVEGTDNRTVQITVPHNTSFLALTNKCSKLLKSLS